ncbi:segregation and condensation protein A [Streptomyces xanthophaeus]|uniref:segregation and condensation protein A n=1 Tax=Streptomyces xanthophaeus TaxID=67385 RepID=UPI00371215D0
MPSSADTGRPPRRSLGRGPGASGPTGGAQGPEAPEPPAEGRTGGGRGANPEEASEAARARAGRLQAPATPHEPDPDPLLPPAAIPAAAEDAVRAPVSRSAASAEDAVRAPVRQSATGEDVASAPHVAVVAEGADHTPVAQSAAAAEVVVRAPVPHAAVVAEGADHPPAQQSAAAEDVATAPAANAAVVPQAAAVEGGVGPVSGEQAQAAVGGGRFTLRLDNFEGPFDLLLQLISRHKLDVTEVALSRVTDEFMAHIRAMGPDWDLDQTTEFLVVAATLLDLKAARLLPAAEVEDEADLALLEARDLLFARLLQYKAYKQIAEIFEQRAEDESRRYPRTVGLEPHHAELLPEVVISIGPEGFARLAVKAMQPKARPQVYVDHIHAPLVSVREQAGLVVRLLKTRGEATFQELTEDAADTLTVVARFLALLELYREKAVVLDQEEALQTLTVRWSGGDGDGMPTVTDEFDQIVEAKE